MKKTVILFILLSCSFYSCVNNSNISNSYQETFSYKGTYESLPANHYLEGYKQSLTIKKQENNKYEIEFWGSKVNGVRGCSFIGEGVVKNDTLWVDVSLEDEGREILMTITPNHDQLGVDVFTKNYDERFRLMLFCNGGGSLAGEYVKNSITKNSIGTFTAENTIADVLQNMPLEQIKKKKGKGEFAEDIYDDYEIYSRNGQHLFTVTPKDTGNINQKINRVLISHPIFKTNKGIHCKSTYQDIKNAYKITKIVPTREHIVIIINELNANVSIPKTSLEKGWWNKKTKTVNANKIPNNAQIDSFVLWWN